MPRYIDAEEIEYYEMFLPTYCNIAFKDDIASIPTADVAPVRHAHREKALSMVGQWYQRCSLCGSRLSAVKQNYCPHCGARMNEEAAP